MNDRKAAAAGDTPQPSSTAETKPAANTPAAPTEAQIKAWITDLLVLMADTYEGRITMAGLSAWGTKAKAQHEFVAESLGQAGLAARDSGLVVLTVTGWREVCRIKADMAATELKKKDDELKAHKKYHQEEQQLLNEIKAAEATLESKKGAVQVAKEDLSAAHEALAAHVAGGVQTSFLDQPKKQDQTGNAPTIAPDWAKVLPQVDAKSVRVFPVKGCPDQKKITTNLIQPELMKQEKRKIEEPIEAFGVPWIVSALWIEEKTGASRANLLPLLTKDEWQQLHEKDLGRAVDAFDQTNEAKHLRQKGGPWCGLVIRSGRQVYVVGPQSSAVHVVHPAPEAAPKK